MKYLLVLLVMLCSCDNVLSPKERGIKLTDCTDKLDCDPYAPPVIGVFNQEKAMFTAQYLVEDAYDEKFGDLWADATVHWANTICPKNGRYAIIYGTQCNFGRMWSCGEMYVALSNSDEATTTGSALLHEFGHCLYMQMNGVNDGCPDHSDDDFWDVIGDAVEISKDRGW